MQVRMLLIIGTIPFFCFCLTAAISLPLIRKTFLGHWVYETCDNLGLKNGKCAVLNFFKYDQK